MSIVLARIILKIGLLLCNNILLECDEFSTFSKESDDRALFRNLQYNSNLFFSNVWMWNVLTWKRSNNFSDPASLLSRRIRRALKRIERRCFFLLREDKYALSLAEKAPNRQYRHSDSHAKDYKDTTFLFLMSNICEHLFEKVSFTKSDWKLIHLKSIETLKFLQAS